MGGLKRESLSASPVKKKIKAAVDDDPKFTSPPLPADEARAKWPKRYLSKSKVKVVALSNGSKEIESSEEDVLQARCHYTEAMIDGSTYNLYDDAYVKAGEGEPDFIAKIVEMFETIDKELYFTAQWFFRAEDTIIKDQTQLIDKRRVFYSETRDDNPLDSIVSKVKIVKIAPNVDLAAKEKLISSSDLYYDMEYSMQYFAFTAIDKVGATNSKAAKTSKVCRVQESKMTLLDLYSGCGAMSTGLSFGAAISGLKLVARWAVDLNPYACKSLETNHPEAKVRNEAAEDFLALLKEWEKLCKEYQLLGSKRYEDVNSKSEDLGEDEDEDADDGFVATPEEFEVRRLLAICYGDPNKVGKSGLYFKVRWKGYGPSEDTWEPIDGLSNCKESIQEFVTQGYKSKILPLPGDVDFICGGPPCQGISGFNRFRNSEDPLKDPKNHQLVVYMDIVGYLKPKYVLMENVVDIVKFSGGALSSYAIGRLVSMNYQTRLGIMAAGSYGVPQCRLRVFLWGAIHTEVLPHFPLPTHEVVGRGVVTNEFKEIIVGFDREESHKLEKRLLLGDAISDMPEVSNDESNDEMPYSGAPRTSFQKYIRLKKQDLFGFAGNNLSQKKMLYDHQPLQLNTDDFARVCRIPKKKGANFRDLPGVMVGSNNKVEWDPSVERVLLPSGKPLVPDYAMTFVRGTSSKPFGRLAMDEIVTTVVTRAEPHNQIILHPNQDRVLTIRENARLQGFPDCYKLCGPVKERYMQVGNAVAFSVSIAMGHALAKATQGISNSKPLILPFKFPECLEQLSSLNQTADESD